MSVYIYIYKCKGACRIYYYTKRCAFPQTRSTILDTANKTESNISINQQPAYNLYHHIYTYNTIKIGCLHIIYNYDRIVSNKGVPR